MAPSCAPRLVQAFGLFLLLACAARAKDVLVLLGDQKMERSHANFLADLRDAGLQLDVKSFTDSQLRLQSWGTWLYDGVLVLAGKTGKVGGALDAAYLVDFVDSGRGLFIATDQHAPDALREVAAELGSDLLDSDAQLTDHISHAPDLGATAPLCPPPTLAPVAGGGDAPILYRGGAMTLSPDATLTTPVLLPAPTATAGSLLGPQLVLATALQTRANARAVIAASTDLFSDAFFAAAAGNRAFAAAAALWAFGERGALRLSNFRHARAGAAAPPPHNTYTVNDTVHVSLDLHENGPRGWEAHVTDALQLEYTMLDPHVRQTMRHEGGGRYALTVRTPDVYGVFKWVVDYKAPGYSGVAVSEVAPLRPLRHDEYPRFIVQAYPYYVALLSVSVAFLALVTVVMYHE